LFEEVLAVAATRKRSSPSTPNRLKELREAARLSQSKLARFVRVRSQTVNRWERGWNEISVRYLIELSKVLRCHPWDIIEATSQTRRAAKAKVRSTLLCNWQALDSSEQQAIELIIAALAKNRVADQSSLSASKAM
jgi:transcriptional regulator with XRE-family HTH domain